MTRIQRCDRWVPATTVRENGIAKTTVGKAIRTRTWERILAGETGLPSAEQHAVDLPENPTVAAPGICTHRPS